MRTTLSQLVAALSVTYDDAGVAMWLSGEHRDGTRPLQMIIEGRIDAVAEKVERIGDASPSEFRVVQADESSER